MRFLFLMPWAPFFIVILLHISYLLITFTHIWVDCWIVSKARGSRNLKATCRRLAASPPYLQVASRVASCSFVRRDKSQTFTRAAAKTQRLRRKANDGRILGQTFLIPIALSTPKLKCKWHVFASQVNLSPIDYVHPCI